MISKGKKLVWVELISVLVLLIFSATGMGMAQGKISGYMFGDYFYVLNSHDSSLKGQNGFWFRRIYFTYDHKLPSDLAVRFRLEMNSPGDFETRDTLKPYIKDAYLSWRKNEHNLFVGISPTPTWEFIEGFWGYRSVEKTPLDLFKMGDSRDLGVAFKGKLSRVFGYHIMFANGEGTKSEVNKEKKVYASFLFSLTEKIQFEFYGDYGQGADHMDNFVYQGFLGYKSKKFRLGLQYSHQRKEQGTGKKTLELDVFSAFMVFKIGKNSIFLRWDRMNDPNPAGPKVSYVPFSGSNPFSLFIAGFDAKLSDNVSFIPNIEYFAYERFEGVKPKNDFHLKLTLFYSWSQ